MSEPGKLDLNDYKRLLAGEIESAIWHNPTDDEFAKFEQYIADYLADCINERKRPDLTGVCVAIHDCRDECFKECAECGEYFLYDEMNQETDYEYCLSCRPHYDPDIEWKSALEQKDEQ